MRKTLVATQLNDVFSSLNFYYRIDSRHESETTVVKFFVWTPAKKSKEYKSTRPLCFSLFSRLTQWSQTRGLRAVCGPQEGPMWHANIRENGDLKEVSGQFVYLLKNIGY